MYLLKVPSHKQQTPFYPKTFLKQYNLFHMLRGNYGFLEPTICIVFLLNHSFYYPMLYILQLTEVPLLPIAFIIYYFHPLKKNTISVLQKLAYAHSFDCQFGHTKLPTLSNYFWISWLLSFIKTFTPDLYFFNPTFCLSVQAMFLFYCMQCPCRWL